MVKLLNGFIVIFLLLTSNFIHPTKVHASATTLYFGSIERTYDDAGTLVEEKRYYPAGSAVAQRTKNMEQGTENMSYLHSDHLGSTVLVTNSTGNTAGSNAYYPYGNMAMVNDQWSMVNENTVTDKLYTGQRKDDSTSLYFYNARYYNPTTGHFISADSAEGPNRYAYVGNNPIMRNDPSGMKEEEGAGFDDKWLEYLRSKKVSLYQMYSHGRNSYNLGPLDMQNIPFADIRNIFPIYKQINPEIYENTALTFGWTDNFGEAWEPGELLIIVENDENQVLNIGAITIGNIGVLTQRQYLDSLDEDIRYYHGQTWKEMFGHDLTDPEQEQQLTALHEYFHLWQLANPQLENLFNDIYTEEERDLKKSSFIPSHIDDNSREKGPIFMEMVYNRPNYYRNKFPGIYNAIYQSDFFLPGILKPPLLPSVRINPYTNEKSLKMEMGY